MARSRSQHSKATTSINTAKEEKKKKALVLELALDEAGARPLCGVSAS
jgi:hypothetical protein